MLLKPLFVPERRANVLLVAFLGAGADLAYERGHLMEGGVVGADAEDALDHKTGLHNGRVAVARDKDNTMDVPLQEGRQPVGNELAVLGRTRVTQVLGVGQLALFERRVEEVIGDAQLIWRQMSRDNGARK